MTSEDKELTSIQQIKYVGIGVLIAITYTVWFIVFFGGSVSDVQVSDFPIEKFNEGYNILTLENGDQLIQLSDFIDYYIDSEGNHNFATVDQSIIKEYHVSDGHETNSYSGYGVGGKGWEVTEVLGIDFDFPVYLVKSVPTNIIGWSILPLAHGQVQPFELQLEQIRNPQECTRKTFTSAGAYLPFTLKVFYDTTQDRKWDVISKAETFPVAQQTAQVATFYSPQVDQYELYLEINYPTVAKRQVYIEVLSEGKTITNWQEKFDDLKFCMTFHINTSEAPTFPTREDLIGDLLTNVDQIPEMIRSFNANTVTWSNSIGFMWTLILGSIVVSVLTLISTGVVNRNLKSKMKDIDEAIDLVDASAQKIDELTEPLNTIIANQEKILNKSPEPIKPEKQSKLSKFRKKKVNVSDDVKKGLKPKKKGRWGFLSRNKDDEDDVTEEDIINSEDRIEVPPKETKIENEKLVKEIEKMESGDDLKVDKPSTTVSEEVLKTLQVKPEEIVEEKGLSGGFIIDDEEKVSPTPLPKEVKMLPEKKPPKFKEVLRSIDFVMNEFKEGTFNKFTYSELNTVYSWIIHYKNRKQHNDEWQNIPEDIRNKQDVAGNIIYHAIMAKLEKKLKDD